MVEKVHFSKDTYVVFRKKNEGEYFTSHEVYEIKRGLTYPSAIGLCNNLYKEDDTQPVLKCGYKICLYNYVTESEFDEFQKPFKHNPQLSLF